MNKFITLWIIIFFCHYAYTMYISKLKNDVLYYIAIGIIMIPYILLDSENILNKNNLKKIIRDHNITIQY